MSWVLLALSLLVNVALARWVMRLRAVELQAIEDMTTAMDKLCGKGNR